MPANHSPVEKIIENIGPVLFLSAFAAVGAWLAVEGVGVVLSARDSIHWPTAQATITKSEVDGRQSRRGKSYEPIIEYTYAVGGKNYTGKQLRIVTQLPRSEAFAQECVSHYPVGGKTNVSYKTTDPSVAALEPGFSKGAFVGLGGGLLFVFAPVWMMVNILNRKRSLWIVGSGFMVMALWMGLMAYLLSA